MKITAHMNSIIEKYGEPKRRFVTRDDDRDLAFKGWKIGEGEIGDGIYRCDWNRGTIVKIYLTTGGNLVACIRQWSNWEGARDRNVAAIFKGAAAAMELLQYLKDDCDGAMGRASKEAWEDVDLEFFPLNEEVS